MYHILSYVGDEGWMYIPWGFICLRRESMKEEEEEGEGEEEIVINTYK